MVINIRLSERTPSDSNDPLPRSWWGYDPAATAEELWRHNRGTWSLDESRLAQEKWVTLNHRGRVIQVIELGDPRFEEVTELETGRKKKALLGTVLSPGHPTYDVLMGTEVARHRNAIGYADDPELPETWVGDIAEDAPASSGQGRHVSGNFKLTGVGKSD